MNHYATDSGIEPQRAVVIGASAGAVDALSRLLPKLSKDFPCPVLVVVHVPPDKKSILAELFERSCKLIVKEAEDKEPIQNGTVYFAPPDYHLLVEPDRRLSLSTEEPVLFSRPSIDVLFETAADSYGCDLTAIVLTGANEDGARGARTIEEAGGRVLVQHPDLAFARAMPEAALKACRHARALGLDEIISTLQHSYQKA